MASEIATQYTHEQHTADTTAATGDRTLGFLERDFHSFLDAFSDIDRSAGECGDPEGALGCIRLVFLGTGGIAALEGAGSSVDRYCVYRGAGTFLGI